MNYFENYFTQMSKCISEVDVSKLKDVSALVQSAKKNNGKVIIAGNGGSAAMASHVAVDFTKAAGIRAINFNEADLITCFANDYGYENWVTEAIKAYADANDLIILISSSGQSENITNAAKTAKQMDLKVVTLSGFLKNNPLRELGDVNLWIDSTAYNFVEMTHHVWLLAIVDYLIEVDEKK